MMLLYILTALACIGAVLLVGYGVQRYTNVALVKRKNAELTRTLDAIDKMAESEYSVTGNAFAANVQRMINPRKEIS